MLGSKSDTLEPFVDPISHVIIEVLYCIRIVPWRRFAPDAGSLIVLRSFNDHEILVLARRNLIVNLIVAYKRGGPHRSDQQGHANVRQVTGRRIVAGAVVDSLHGISSPNGSRTEKRSDG